jgi:hypothetical protein
VKFGVTFQQSGIGIDPIAIRDFAQAAEGAGFDYLVTYDHILGVHPDRFVGRDVGFPSPPYLYDSQRDRSIGRNLQRCVLDSL